MTLVEDWIYYFRYYGKWRWENKSRNPSSDAHRFRNNNIFSDKRYYWLCSDYGIPHPAPVLRVATREVTENGDNTGWLWHRVSRSISCFVTDPQIYQSERLSNVQLWAVTQRFSNQDSTFPQLNEQDIFGYSRGHGAWTLKCTVNQCIPICPSWRIIGIRS